MNEKEIKEIKEVFKRDDIFTIFVENHLNHYPNERIDGFGITQNISPISAIKLSGYLTQLQKNIEENDFSMKYIIDDIVNVSKTSRFTK